jgi:uncharacterized protein HemY
MESGRREQAMTNNEMVFSILSVALGALLGIRFVVYEVREVVKRVLSLIEYIDDWRFRRRLRKAQLSTIDISLDKPKINSNHRRARDPHRVL